MFSCWRFPNNLDAWYRNYHLFIQLCDIYNIVVMYLIFQIWPINSKYLVEIQTTFNRFDRQIALFTLKETDELLSLFWRKSQIQSLDHKYNIYCMYNSKLVTFWPTERIHLIGYIKNYSFSWIEFDNSLKKEWIWIFTPKIWNDKQEAF